MKWKSSSPHKSLASLNSFFTRRDWLDRTSYHQTSVMKRQWKLTSAEDAQTFQRLPLAQLAIKFHSVYGPDILSTGSLVFKAVLSSHQAPSCIRGPGSTLLYIDSTPISYFVISVNAYDPGQLVTDVDIGTIIDYYQSSSGVYLRGCLKTRFYTLDWPYVKCIRIPIGNALWRVMLSARVPTV